MQLTVPKNKGFFVIHHLGKASRSLRREFLVDTTLNICTVTNPPSRVSNWGAGASTFTSGMRGLSGMPVQPRNDEFSDGYETNRNGTELSSSALTKTSALSPPVGEASSCLVSEANSNASALAARAGVGQPTRLRLPFSSPLTSLSANRDLSMSATTAFGVGVNALHDALPTKVAENPLYRTAEVAADIGFHWGPAVLFHEWAHYREGVALGWDPTVCGFNWWGGMVCYGDTTGATWADAARASAAGLNNEEWIGRSHHTRISLGQPDYHDAVGMLLPDLQTSAYLGRTLTRDATRGDDNLSWARAAAHQGNSVTLDSMFTKSLIADLASVDNWHAAYRGFRYIATGERRFEPLTWRIGDVSATFPKFHYFRTSNDEVFEGRVFLNPRRPGALELSGAMSLAEKDFRLGVGMHNISFLEGNLSLSPYASLSFSSGDSLRLSGGSIGVEADASLTQWLGLHATLGFSSNDLLNNRAMHEPDGFKAAVGLTLRIPN